MRSTPRTILYALAVIILSLSLSAAGCSLFGGSNSSSSGASSSSSSSSSSANSSTGTGVDSGAGQGSKGWRVWIRVEPCSGRFDWLTIAKEEPPGAGAGKNHYIPYETEFGNKGCNQSEPFGCTYEEAKALMESIRFDNKFFNYCCKDYSVWRDIETNKYTIVMGKPVQSPGPNWLFVKGDLCCEQAEELAGLPGACSGKRGNEQAGYLGCFKDTGTYDLDGYLVRSQNNTPERCIATCREKGFKYAGVQFGESCLCGNSYGKYGPASNCDYKCTGDSSKICGGYSANSIYSTGAQGNEGKTGTGSGSSDKCTECTKKCAKECEGVMVLLCVVSGGYQNSSRCKQCFDSCMK